MEIAQVDRDRTERGDERIRIRFGSKPDHDLLKILKSCHAKYRNMGRGTKAWFLPIAHCKILCDKLDKEPYKLLRDVLNLYCPVNDDVVEDPLADDAADDDAADEPPPPPLPAASPPLPDDTEEAPPPRKRQRRSTRVEPGTCFACQYEVRMLNATGRYHESPIPHDLTCGF